MYSRRVSSEISKAFYRSNLRSTAIKRMQQNEILKHSGSSRWSWCQRTIGNIRNIHHKCSTHRVFNVGAARWATLGCGTKNKIQRHRKRKRMSLMKYLYVFSGRSGLTSNCVVMVALPSNQMDSIFGTEVGATPLMILICKLYQPLSLGVNPMMVHGAYREGPSTVEAL